MVIVFRESGLHPILLFTRLNNPSSSRLSSQSLIPRVLFLSLHSLKAFLFSYSIIHLCLRPLKGMRYKGKNQGVSNKAIQDFQRQLELLHVQALLHPVCVIPGKFSKLFRSQCPYCINHTSYFFFFEMEFCSCCPGLGATASSWLTATSASQVQVILLPQLPE